LAAHCRLPSCPPRRSSDLLIPYVLGAIEDSVRTGLPVQRSMALSFPHDAHAHEWDLQYLLGPALLVAPVTRPGNSVRVYLPKGEDRKSTRLNSSHVKISYA